MKHGNIFNTINVIAFVININIRSTTEVGYRLMEKVFVGIISYVPFYALFVAEAQRLRSGVVVS